MYNSHCYLINFIVNVLIYPILTMNKKLLLNKLRSIIGRQG